MNKKNLQESAAFAEIIAEVEKEKKKTRVLYFVAIVVLSMSLITFLLFSSLRIPIFSQLGDKILGRDQLVENKKTELGDNLEDEVEKEEKKIEEVNEEVTDNNTVPVTTPRTSSPTPSAPVYTPKTYVCSDQEIADLRNEITILEQYKKESEDNMNAHFFACFDVVISTYPNETESFYQQECWREVCINYSPELCEAPNTFQEGIEFAQTELNHCLSDR